MTVEQFSIQKEVKDYEESIKDFIAFPKNTSGRDMMIDSPSLIDKNQLKELGL